MNRAVKKEVAIPLFSWNLQKKKSESLKKQEILTFLNFFGMLIVIKKGKDRGAYNENTT